MWAEKYLLHLESLGMKWWPSGKKRKNVKRRFWNVDDFYLLSLYKHNNIDPIVQIYDTLAPQDFDKSW